MLNKCVLAVMILMLSVGASFADDDVSLYFQLERLNPGTTFSAGTSLTYALVAKGFNKALEVWSFTGNHIVCEDQGVALSDAQATVTQISQYTFVVIAKKATADMLVYMAGRGELKPSIKNVRVYPTRVIDSKPIWIDFVPKGAIIRICDYKGQKVWEVKMDTDAGRLLYEWKNGAGRQTASGVYFYLVMMPGQDSVSGPIVNTRMTR